MVPQLRDPLLALKISFDPKQRIAILRDEKKITIREGHRDYRPGPVALFCHIVPWAVMAEITEVRHTLLKDVTREEWKDDGFESRQELLRGLQRYYSKIGWESPVTVIRWDNLEGLWANLPETYARAHMGQEDSTDDENLAPRFV